MTTTALCPYGRPLHYLRPESQHVIEWFVRTLGPTIVVTVPTVGAWLVPRHYIALHGLAAADLPALAAQYGWEQTA